MQTNVVAEELHTTVDGGRQQKLYIYILQYTSPIVVGGFLSKCAQEGLKEQCCRVFSVSATEPNHVE